MSECWKQRIILRVLILCILPAHSGWSALVRTVTVLGNASVSRADIVSWMSLRPGLPYAAAALDEDVTRVSTGYRQRGFFGAVAKKGEVVYSPDSASVDIALEIDEGKQTVLDAMRLEGVTALRPEDLLADFATRTGEPLDQARLERDIDALLERYEQTGYPFARCGIRGVDVNTGADRDLLTVHLAVEEGALVRIDEVRVEGNTETATDVILRETRLSPGEVFNPARVRAVQDRLNRMSIFSSVSEPELYVRGEHGGLLLRVQEGNTNTFDGIIGYAPAAAGQPGVVTGYAAVGMRNLFGTGRKLQLRWQKEDRQSQELSLRYVEPWILGAPINIEGGFQQRRQDTTYVQQAGDLKAELMLSSVLSASLFVRTESVIPSERPLLQSVERSSTHAVGVELQYDTRNDAYSPTGGARYRIDYSYGRRKADMPGTIVRSSAPLQRLSLDLDAFLPTFSRQVLALGIHGREVKGGRLTESEMVRFGGTRTLRGYRENEFLGARAVWTSTEFRLLVARRSFVMAFVDLGYYVRPADTARLLERIEAFKYGYGMGVRLDTPLGNMSVTFALGRDDSFGKGKIHIGLINEF